MRTIFLLFILFSVSLFPSEIDPLVLVYNSVNALTGEVVIQQDDGNLEDLPLPRVYRSQKEKWEFIPHTHLTLFAKKEKNNTYSYSIAKVAEPNGLELTYRLSSGIQYDLELPKGITNTSQNWINGRTNLKNQKLLRTDAFTIKLITPERIERIYRKVYNEDQHLHFLLQAEHFPNGKTISYEYDQKNRIYSIKNEAMSAQFNYQENSKDFDIVLSNGKSYSYIYKKKLKMIKGAEKPITYNYAKFRLTKFSDIIYSYTPEGKVRKIKTPQEKKYFFSYFPRRTEVISPDKSKTIYFYSQNDLPEKIETRDASNVLKSRIECKWSEKGELLAKSEFKNDQTFSVMYVYDPRGNPIEETTLTLRLTREFDSLDRVIKETTDKETSFEYLQNTDLVTAKIEKKGTSCLRTFFAYDQKGVLKQVTFDNWPDFSYKKVIEIEGGPEHPSIVIEKDDDRILRKTLYYYRDTNILEETYDPSNQLCDSKTVSFASMHRPWLEFIPIGISLEDGIEVERDYFGRIIAKKYYGSNQELVKEELWQYNTCRLLSKEENTPPSQTRVDYDPKTGLIMSIIEKKGPRILRKFYAYDPSNLLNRVTIDDGPNFSYQRVIEIEGGPEHPATVIEKAEDRVLRKTLYHYSDTHILEETYDAGNQLCASKRVSLTSMHRPWLEFIPIGISIEEGVQVERDYFGRVIAKKYYGSNRELLKEELWQYNTCRLLSKEENTPTDQKRIEYDAKSGLVTGIIEKEAGRILRTFYTYDPSDLLNRVTIDDGPNFSYRRVIEIEGGPDHPTAVIEKADTLVLRKTLYHYRESNILEEIYDSSNQLCASRAVSAAAMHRPWQQIIPIGISIEDGVEIERDYFGRVIAKKHYDQNRQLLKEERWQYNTCSLLSKEENTPGAQKRVEYDGNTGLVTGIIEKQSGRILRTFYSYDSSNLLNRVTIDDGPKFSYRRVIEIEGGPEHPHLVIEKAGEEVLKKTLYHEIQEGILEETYDAKDQLCSKRIADLSTLHRPWEQIYLIGTSLEDGIEVERDYFGRVIAKKIYDSNQKVLKQEFWQYDICRLRAKEEITQEKRLRFEYDALGRLTKEISNKTFLYEYLDQTNLLTSKIEEKDSQVLRTFYRYDKNHVLNQVIIDNGPNYTYQRVIEIEGGPQHPTAVLEKAGDRLLRKTVTHYGKEQILEEIYDGDGTLCFRRTIPETAIHKPWEVIIAIGISKDDAIEEERDYFGRVIAKRVYDSSGYLLSEESWKYNAFNLISKIDSTGLETHYFYDTFGRKEKEIIETSQGNIETKFSYDAVGRIAKVQTENLLTCYEYDEKDQIIEKREEDLKGNLISKISFSFDGVQKIATVQMDEKTASYPLIKKEKIPQPQCHKKGVHCTYDPLGRLTEIYTDDQTVHYTLKYNKRSQPMELTDHVLGLHAYRVYDEIGNLIEETLLNGQTLKSEYDLRSRRTQLILPDGSKIFYKWGPKFIEEIYRSTYRARYEYRHQFTHYDLAGFPTKQRFIEGFGEISYDLNSDLKIEGIHSRHFEQKASQLEDIELPSVANSYTYKCDGLGRIIELQQPKRKIYFTYDFWNRRLSKRVVEYVDGAWKETLFFAFLYDDQKEIGAMDMTENWLRQLRVCAPHPINTADQAIAYELEAMPYIPLHDLKGNVKQLLSVIRRKVMETYSYSPSGREKIVDVWEDPIPTSKAGNPWRFHSERIDEESGLVYIDGEYYDPNTKSFIGDASKKLPQFGLFEIPKERGQSLEQ